MRSLMAVALMTSVTACLPIGEGMSVPDARLTVSLPEPMAQEMVVERVRGIAYAHGFRHHWGTGWDPPPGKRRTVLNSWNDRPTLPSYGYGALWPADVRRVSSFQVILYHRGPVAFTLEEWRMFIRLGDELLPQQFPDAEIEVTRHPAEFTQPWDLERFAAATGLSLPSDARRRVERWEARSDWEQWRERTYWTLRRWWYHIRTGRLWNNDEEEVRKATAT